MSSKLGKLLLNHSSNSTKEVSDVDVDAINELTVSGGAYPTNFKVPELKGQTADELLEEMSPDFIAACAVVAKRALTGEVNPTLEGNFPHKMALLLAAKMAPSNKKGDKPQELTPSATKKTARALDSLIASLVNDDGLTIDTTSQKIDGLDPSKAVKYTVRGEVIKS